MWYLKSLDRRMLRVSKLRPGGLGDRNLAENHHLKVELKLVWMLLGGSVRS